MNYDLTGIPAVYDRARDHGPEMLDLWMDTLQAHLDGRTINVILDLGCGTGRFSESLALRFHADVIGLDPSANMLEQARQKRRDERVQYQQGHAEAIPLAAQSVDAIFISMSFHHFSDAGLAARECRRVLRDPGTVLVRTGTHERIASYPYVPFFPTSWPLLDEVLPTGSRVREVFEAAGFQTMASQLITQTIAPTWAAYAEKIAAGGDSVLARLSARDFQAGLEALRRHAAGALHQAIVEPIDLFVFRVPVHG
ncbi:MAG: class I SAM-dependent methyltransferase [Longimicrobiales bacterium]